MWVTVLVDFQFANAIDLVQSLWVCSGLILIASLAALCSMVAYNAMTYMYWEDVGVYVHRLGRCMCKCACKRRREVIVIEDSPPPTRYPVSPFPPTPKRRTPRSASRAGAMRVSCHKRPSTRRHNPCLPNHCGYSCVIASRHRQKAYEEIYSYFEEEDSRDCGACICPQQDPGGDSL